MATLNEKKTCSQRMENFQRFVWNPDTGQLMGRTLINWVWISLYYVAFYVVVTGLFALSIFSLMMTLNPYTPDYQDRLKSPGVTLRPDVYGEKGLEIYYNVSEEHSWEGFVKTLQKFLSGYNETAQQANKNCYREGYYFQKKFDAPNHTKHSCKFTQEMLGNCSGLVDPNFGFSEGSPCLIIKMNRIINFLPGNGTEPRVNCTTLVKYYVLVLQLVLLEVTGSFEGHCSQLEKHFCNCIVEGIHGRNHWVVDDESPLDVQYYPRNGTFKLHYFPYYGCKAQPSYSNPLVAVKLLNVPINKEIHVVCRVVGTGITSDNPHDPYEGKVEFKVCIKA